MAGVSKGAAGEVLAARFLRTKGYEVLCSNYRTRFGEIDIIAVNKQYIAFVEVKTRSEDALYTPRKAVTAAKQDRIIKTALLFLKEHPVDLQPRFDVIEIVTEKAHPMTVLELDYIQSAYEAGEGYAAF